MANTFTQLTCHAIFAVKYRDAVLTESIRPKVFGFLSECLSVRNQTPLAVGGFSDHVHVLFGFTPDARLSDIIGQIKSDSSAWINAHKLCNGHFHWQTGYSAFTCSKDHRRRAIQYIMDQEKHHRVCSFREEYLSLMIENDVHVDERYAFEFFDDI
jgi:REP element-mobilizing transposase RayT